MFALPNLNLHPVSKIEVPTKVSSIIEHIAIHNRDVARDS